MDSRKAPIRVGTARRDTVGATAVQGGNVPCHRLLIKAVSPGQTVYVGASAAVTTATGYPLADGASLQLDVPNLNTLWFIASAADQAIAVLPLSTY